MDLRERIDYLRLRLSPDRHVREAVRERARQATERRRDPELMRMLAAELRAQAQVAAELDLEIQRQRAVAESRAPELAPGARVAAVVAERGRAPESLPVGTWDALAVSAATRTEQHLFRDRAEVLATVGVRPETVAAAAVAGGVVVAAAAEAEDGVVRPGLRCAGAAELPVAMRVVITRSALDAVAIAQIQPDPAAVCVSVGAQVDETTLRELRGVIEGAVARLRAVRPEAHLTAVLAFGRREAAVAGLVHGAIPPGVGVEQHNPPGGESWAGHLAKVEQEFARRARLRSQTVGRRRGPAL